MTDQKDTMPDEIYSFGSDKNIVYMSGASPVTAYDRQITHPIKGPAEKYHHDRIVQAKDAEIANLKEAIEKDDCNLVRILRRDIAEFKDEIERVRQERDLLARGVMDAPHGCFDEALKLAREIIEDKFDCDDGEE